jgi:hypothetical protein
MGWEFRLNYIILCLNIEILDLTTFKKKVNKSVIPDSMENEKANDTMIAEITLVA